MRLLAVAALTLTMGAQCATGAAAGERSAADRFLEPSTKVADFTPAALRTADDLDQRVQRSSRLSAPEAGEVDYDWRTDRVRLGGSGGRAINSLQVSVGRSLRAPGGLPLSMGRAAYEPDAYEVALRRDWSAARFDAGAYDVDISPHAGLGWTNQGGALAEAGARLQITQRSDDEVREALEDLGVRDGAEFGDRGRWYLFAAASGRAVGLNMMRDVGEWDQAGLSTDSASALIGDAHLGVGWRKGPLQTSLGYVHREVKGQNMIWGQQTKEDSLLAFSLTIKPQRD